ncbi:MAG: hypothetical protein DSY78_08455, partial [Chloroflexi bacterium]
MPGSGPDWVKRWKKYVKSEPAVHIQDLCLPGPITNERIIVQLERSDSQLRAKKDYQGVNALVWNTLVFIHGGGPVICRESLKIDSAEKPPENDKIPEELFSEFPMPLRLQEVRIMALRYNETQGSKSG